MNIKLANKGDINEIMVLIEKVNKKLLSLGFSNWNKGYPNQQIVEKDIENDEQYKLMDFNQNGHNIIGIYSLAKFHYPIFDKLKFTDKTNNYGMIHRVAVIPEYQNRGYAKLMMDNAENILRIKRYFSIRLGVISSNDKLVEFYLNRDYKIKGSENFEIDESPFYLMEKIIK